MNIDLQKFQALRESVRARETATRQAAAKPADKADWRTLLENKRKELGLSPAAPTAKQEAASAAKKAVAKAVAADFDGTIGEQVNSLRERSAEGLPVRELGNFIDVRA